MNSEPVQYHSSADLGNLLTVEEGEIFFRILIFVGRKRKDYTLLSMLAVLFLILVV